MVTHLRTEEVTGTQEGELRVNVMEAVMGLMANAVWEELEQGRTSANTPSHLSHLPLELEENITMLISTVLMEEVEEECW